MRRVTFAVGILVFLAAMGLVGWALIKAVEAEPAVVGSLLTAFSAVIAVVIGQHWQQKLQLRQTHRDEMLPLYAKFVNQIRQAGDTTHKERATGDPGDPTVFPETAKFLEEFKYTLLLRGPAPVIKAVHRFGQAADELDVNADEKDPSALLAYEALLRAIRDDLGHDDSSLKEGDLLRLFVTDIDDFLPAT